MNQQVRDFVDGITADNLSDYFEIVKDYPVFSATPDENGWVDFGTQYIEKEDYVANGGSGEVSNWLAEDEYFSVNAITMSGNDGKEDAPHFGFLLFSAMKTEVLQKHCIRLNRTASI